MNSGSAAVVNDGSEGCHSLRRVGAGLTVVAAVAAAFIAGCGGSGSLRTPPEGEGDPLLVAKDDDANTGHRVRAVERIWEEAEAGRVERGVARKNLKSLIWTRQPPAVRVRAVEVLLRDQTPEGLADTRKMLGLRLPTEVDWAVIGLICDTAADRGWTDLTPAIVRSFARPVNTPDDERPERSALERLHPGVPLAETVYRVFATPAEGVTPDGEAIRGSAAERAERARRDAWELLARLDPAGEARRELLSAEPGGATGDAMIDTLRATARELRAVPVTGSELEWATAMRGSTSWWSSAAAAVGGLSEEQVSGFALRHAEPVRWASVHRPEWLLADRPALLAELASRLSERKVHEREAEAGSPFGARRERLRDNEASLAWGDILTILVVDEALRDASVVAALFEQAGIDRRDTSTEHGGVLEAVEGVGGAGASGGFRALHFPPRPAQRRDDSTFIAPEDMFRHSATALAHYHFHVQRHRNAPYAGPGPGDVEYAQKHGRACLVLTSVEEGRMNVDYYQRGGAVVDLGEVRAER